MKTRVCWCALLLPALMMGCSDESTEGESNGCTVGDDSSCGPGLECQPVAGGQPGCFCSPSYNTGCDNGLVCELVVNSNSGCYPPVTVHGHVFDLETDAAVEGARVVARDANNVAVSDVAITDVNGDYDLAVPTARTTAGALSKTDVSLRADAEGYMTFPTPPRIALPFDMANATGNPPVLESSATDVGLLPLSSATGLGTITGTVLAAHPRGTLVVAGGTAGTGGGVTGIADFDGTYAVFNVPAGSVEVHGYAAGLQLQPATATVTAGQVTEHVDLQDLGAATAVVSGKVEIVNPGNGSDTSIILVVDETFNADLASTLGIVTGEAPPGLRAYPVSGAWQIPDVPNGNYVVLAAFENDFLVRDPDTSIGGTSIVRVTVSGSSVTLDESFKITGSLDHPSPDAEEVVSGTPTFAWDDDSSEDHYVVVVFDAYGNLVWQKDDVPGVSGSSTVTVQYGGPALTSGLLYQFRATSIKQGGTPISRTEDLRGVFLYQ